MAAGQGRGCATVEPEAVAMAAAAAAEAPLSGVGWAAALEAVPAGWTAITVTVEGAAANLGRGFGHKGGGGGGYLCVSTGGAQAPPSSVVTDVVVLSERSPQPAGYSRIPEFPEPRPGGSRKKRLYVKLLPAEAAERAVLDLKLSSKGKALPQYLRVGDLGHLAVWCKKGAVVKPNPPRPPLPRPRSISAGLRQLSLQGSQSPTGSSPKQLQPCPDPSSIYGLSAMDGVPFTLHPRFEGRLSSSSSGLLKDLNVKSLAEIEEEYSYGFVVERTAAARLPPRGC